jgi:hypothetical protein
MKKIIFLLLTAVIFTGFVFAAETAHPPGDVSLKAALSEYNADSPVVASGTVLVSAKTATAEPSSFMAVMVTESTVQPQRNNASSMSLNFRRTWAVLAAANYYLRC